LCPGKQQMLGRRKINLPKSAAALKLPDSFVSERIFKPSSFCEALLLWTRKLPNRRPEKIAVVHHKEYSLPDWDPSHRFVMSKFDGIVNEIEADQSLKSVVRFIAPDAPASPELLELVHTPDYVRSFCDGTLDPASMRKIGLPWSPGLVRRTTLEVLPKTLLVFSSPRYSMRSSRGTRSLTKMDGHMNPMQHAPPCPSPPPFQVAGTVEATRIAAREGLACHVGGGTHHAFAGHGSGFTIFNDLAVAARAARKEGLARRCLIVDLDVHQAPPRAHDPRPTPMARPARGARRTDGQVRRGRIRSPHVLLVR
jgi:hypothetical protein